MPTSLRIAQLDVTDLKLLTDDFASLETLHAQLQRLIRRHLPEVTASLLAVPKPASDGKTVDWYSDLAGQPALLRSLPADQQVVVREKLNDRLGSLKRLAAELPGMARGSEESAALLELATHYPGDEFVYVVGDEPVLTLWGFVSINDKRTGIASIGPANADNTGGDLAPGRRRGARLLWIPLLLFGIGAVAGGWLWLDHQREQALSTELDQAIVADCTAPDALTALEAHLIELDPAGDRHADIRERLGAEKDRCRVAMRLEEGLVAAQWDCPRLTVMREEMAEQDLSRQPFAGLAEQLDERIAACVEAADFTGRLEQAARDCTHIAELDQELGEPLAGVEPLQQVRGRIDAEIERCEAAVRFAEDLETNIARCENLHRLDGEMGGFDVERPPLASIRQRLDAELTLCGRAAAYRQELVDAQMDCALLQKLDERMQGEDVTREPLQSVRQRLDGALEQCKTLEELEQAMQDAAGDCAKLAGLAERMQGLFPRNPIFVGVKQRIADETRVCDITQQLQAKLAAAVGNCAILNELESQVKAQLADDPRFQPIRSKLAAELALCGEAAEWRRRVAAAGSNCTSLKAVLKQMQQAGTGAPQLAAINGELEATVQRCERVVVAEAKKEQRRQEKAQTRTKCPGIRKKQEAPQLALVFDASGSMEHVLLKDTDTERRLRQMGGNRWTAGVAEQMRRQLRLTNPGLPSRMKVAKQATTRIVRELPQDVDVGLVKIENCPRATNGGFFSPAQRGRLLAQISGLRPRSKTPLASAISQAADMLDGVNRQGVIVVVSDGEDTCHGDPCAVARRIAKKKPGIRINVVDITGTGSANCAASATGGRVFKANNAQELNRQLRRATQEVRGPAECRRK